MIFQLLKNLFYKYQIKIYSNKVPFFTIRQFGPKKNYTKFQVDSVIKKWPLNSNYIHIAYAILLTEKDYKNTLKKKQAEHDYLKIRKQIAAHYFNGNTDFTVCDLLFKSYYRGGAIYKSTPFAAEWQSDASFFECLDFCNKKNLFNLIKY